MEPILIIGLGGTGMKIGYGTKYLFETHSPELLYSENNKRGLVKFLFIENDINEVELCAQKFGRGTKNLVDPTEIALLVNSDPGKKIFNAKRGQEKDQDLLSWIDTDVVAEMGTASHGLKGNRPLGRIAFYDNFANVRTKIKDAYDKLASAEAGNTRKPFVYLISSICGGTGSSCFFDVSIIVDALMQSQTNKRAFLINHKVYLDAKSKQGLGPDDPQVKALKINAQAFYNECKHFMLNQSRSAMAQYSVKQKEYSSYVQTGTVPFKPWGFAFIFDNVTDKQAVLSNEKFHETISNIIYHDTIGNASLVVNSTNFVNKNINDESEELFFNSIGYLTIKFPKNEFSKYFKARFKFELFKNHLLNEDYSREKIMKEAESFLSVEVKEVYNLISNQLREKCRTDRDIKALRDLTIRNDPSELADASDLASHPLIINNFAGNSTKLLNSIIIRNVSQTRVEKDILDNLIAKIYLKLNTLMMEHGFFAAVGTQNEANTGFLDYLERYCKEEYVRLKKEFNILNNSQSEVTKSLEFLVTSISKKKALVRRKTWQDLESEVSDYNKKLKSFEENVIRGIELELEMELLYYFAAGDDSTTIAGSKLGINTIPQSTISKIQRAFENFLFGAASGPSVKSLCSEYSDGRKESSDTILNQYLISLPLEYINTEIDIFTKYIPHKLKDYIENNPSTQLSENNFTGNPWKLGTDLDLLFSNHVSINVSDIFPEEIYLVKLALQTDKTKTLAAMREIIDAYIVRYFENNNEISEFLNTKVDVAWNNSSQGRKDEIRDQIAYLDFPLLAPGRVQSSTYVNIDANEVQALSSFANTLAANTSIVGQRNYGSNQITFTQYINGIMFEKIHYNDLSEHEYNARGKNFRPHLHKDWNNHPKGVLGYFFDNKPIDVKIGTSTLNEIDLFYLCLYLNHFDLSKLYVSQDTAKRFEYEKNASTPFIVDDLMMVFKLAEFVMVEEKGVLKFGLKKAKKIDFSFKHPDFPSLLKEITGKSESLNDFITFCNEYSAELEAQLKTKALKTKISKFIDKVLKDIRIARNSKDVSKEDKKMLDEFTSKFNDSIAKFSKRFSV